MLFHLAPFSPTRRPQRGSAIVLVLFLLIFMVIMGLVYLTSSRNEKTAGQANARKESSDDAVQAAIVAIGSQISDDYVNNFLKVTAATPYENFIVYPNAQHSFLAPVDGYKSTGYTSGGYTGPFDTWRQISVLYPGEPFVSPGNPFAALPPASLKIPNVNPGVAEGLGWEQTTPDPNPNSQLYDSRIQVLHVPSADGTVWLISVHTVDCSGMINVNTATQFTNRANGDAAVARNPSSVDLYGTLVRFGFVGPSYLTPTTLQQNWTAAPIAGTFAGGFVQARGFSLTRYVDTSIPFAATLGTPPFGRDDMWNTLGVNLHTVYNDAGGGPLGGFYAFGPADEAVLRSGSTNFFTQSTLQLAINGQGGSPAANPLLNSSPRLGGVPLRRYLTTYNAVSLRAQTGAVDAGNNQIYRVPMPPFLDALDGAANFGPAVPVSPTNPIPYYKLNPNPVSQGGDAPDDVRNLMVAVLTQNAYDNTVAPGTPGNTYYEYTTHDDGYPAPTLTSLFAYHSAYWLDASLRQYTNTLQNGGIAADISDFTNFPVTPNTAMDSVTDPNTVFYPANVQPFLTEAVSIRVAGEPGLSPPPAHTPDTLTLIVEIRNPFLATDIDLKNYSLRIDGTDYPLKGTLHGLNPTAGDDMTTNVVYCCCENPAGDGTLDPNVQTLLQSATGTGLTAAQMTSQTCVLKGLSPVSVDPADPTSKTPKWDILLVYNSPNNKDATNKPISVVVDRLRPATPDSGKWPAVAIANPAPPAAGTISSASIQRDCGYYSYAGTAIPTAAMPKYVFENANAINYTKESDHAAPGTTFDNISIPNALKFPAATITAALTPTTRFIPSWKLGHLAASPEFRILVTRAGNNAASPMDSVGELANLLTVGHVHSASVDDPVSVNLYYRLVSTPGQFQTQFARLITSEYCLAGGANDPRLPLGCLLLDAFDLVPASNIQPVISGMININTAPLPVLRALPFLGDPNVNGQGLAPNAADNLSYTIPTGIQAYRDRLIDPNFVLGTPQIPNPRYYDFSTNYASLGPPVLSREFTGIANLRLPGALADNDFGYVSTSELLCVHSSDTGTLASTPGAFDPLTGTNQASMAAIGTNLLARDSDPLNFYYPGEKANGTLNGNATGDGSNSGPIDPSGSQVLNDAVRSNALFNLMSNSVDVRGDVFTSYVKLIGVRQINGVWTNVTTRRFAVVFDRTNVHNQGDMPKVLMFVEW